MKVWTRRFLMVLLISPFSLQSAIAAEPKSNKLDATIFSFDGQDFVRTATSISAEEKSATNTKLDHNSDAYVALVKKRSFSGRVTVFGRDYDAKYAPIVDDDGKLTGALFVGVPK